MCFYFYAFSSNCQIIVVVQVNCLYVGVCCHAQSHQFLPFVRNPILSEIYSHVECLSKSLPGVTGSMGVDIQVAVKDLVYGLF